MNMIDFITVALTGLITVAIFWINIWYWQSRRKMTEAEKRLEDDDLRNPGDW